MARTVVCPHVGATGPSRLRAFGPALPPSIGLGRAVAKHSMSRGGGQTAFSRVAKAAPTPIWSRFVTDRIRRYARAISKPEGSREGCSRLSALSGLGQLEHPSGAPASSTCSQGGSWTGWSARNFSAFDSRLRWHCHFIQKFEMEDRMEFDNVNRGYDLLEQSQ